MSETKPKTGVGTPTPDESGSYGDSTIPKTSNDGKGGEPEKDEAAKPQTPPHVPPSTPAVGTGIPATPAVRPGQPQPGAAPPQHVPPQVPPR